MPLFLLSTSCGPRGHPTHLDWMIINLHVSEFTGRTDDKPRGKIKQRASEVQVQRQQHAPVTSLNSIHHRWQKMEIHIRKSQRREGGREGEAESKRVCACVHVHTYAPRTADCCVPGWRSLYTHEHWHLMASGPWLCTTINRHPVRAFLFPAFHKLHDFPVHVPIHW